jgi:hypothetical protein
MAFTVVPLHNISLGAGIEIPFANGFVFQDVPAWLKKDQDLLKNLSFQDRESAMDAEHALVAEYPAAAIGEPDLTGQALNQDQFRKQNFNPSS